jgi:hypothetical protein
MRRRLLPVAVLAAATFGLGACQQQAAQQVVMVPTQACDTSFAVANQSSATVAQLFFSHSSQNGWGTDQLGQAVLPPGRFVNYRAANTGNYDFRVVWSNGRAAEIRGVNICRASRITVTNSGLIAS